MSEEDESAARRMLALCRILRALLIGQVLLGLVYFLVDALPGFVAFFPFIQAYQKSGNVVDIAPSLILLFVYLSDAYALFKIWSRFGAQYRELKRDS